MLTFDYELIRYASFNHLLYIITIIGSLTNIKVLQYFLLKALPFLPLFLLFQYTSMLLDYHYFTNNFYKYLPIELENNLYKVIVKGS